MQSKVQIVNLSKKFRQLILLENVHLNVAQNSIVGIVGPNGSGKTTLLKMMCGLSYPDEGEIHIDGQRLKRGDLASSVGIVLGNPAFIDTMTGFDNLKYLASIQNKINKKEIHEAMDRVGLDSSLNTKVKDYSLGMKSRLGLAQAIMERPNLLLLDEPTNALDQEGLQMLKELLFEYKDAGNTIVLISHDYDFMNEIADSVYQINRQQLEEVSR